MRIVIVGPGAIGCLLSGLLAEAGKRVLLLDKNPSRARAIEAQGIRIDDDRGSRVVNVEITADPSAIGRADLLFLCVKSYDVGPAMVRSALSVGTRTTVVPFSNGCGNVEQVAETVPAGRIVCGITSQGSTSLGIGHICHAGRGLTTLAACVPSERGRAEEVANLLAESGLEASVSDDMRAMIWNKLIVSAAINPVSAVFNMANGQLLEDPAALETLRLLALEAAAVARAMGISSSACLDPAREAERVCRDTAHNVSSMLQDVRNGRRTEIEAITGMIVKEARAAGVAVPANEKLMAQVRELEAQNKRKNNET